jgi:exodeoxyribonuclease VII large subunit
MPERLPPKPATSAGQFDLFGKRTGPRVYSVSELTREIKGVLEGRFPQILIKGEVSNFTRSGAGHVYFTLKDEEACLSAVLFRTEASRLRFELRDGMSVLLRGRIAVHEPRGQYQIICDSVEPLGAGALQIAFEQLKDKLHKEGLFAHERKRRMPFIPRRIAVVTSPSGAVVHDFLRVLHRRFPGLAVLIVPVRVQGEGAAQEIARGITRAGKQRRVEVVVVARGGGSLEDLQAFNEEVVARALAACPAPTVSAVGHEVDVTIADLVADARAPTPTAAAELLAPVREELLADVAQRRARLLRALRGQIERKRAQLEKMRVADPRRLIGDRKLRLDRLRQRLEDALHAQLSLRLARQQKLRDRLQLQHPREKLHRLHREATRLQEKLRSLAHKALAARKQRFEGLVGKLDTLSPLRVLARGYSVTFDTRGRAVRSASEVQPGEQVRVRLHEGELAARVLKRG